MPHGYQMGYIPAVAVVCSNCGYMTTFRFVGRVTNGRPGSTYTGKFPTRWRIGVAAYT
jgi:hypothetical protein